MDEQKVAPLVARVSEVVAARLEEIASEAGVSYHTLYAWGRGRRHASPRHLLRLAEVVRRRAALLEELAAELEQQATAAQPQASTRAQPAARARAAPPGGANGSGARSASTLARTNGARPGGRTP
jgi:hypothetical protein